MSAPVCEAPPAPSTRGSLRRPHATRSDLSIDRRAFLGRVPALAVVAAACREEPSESTSAPPRPSSTVETVLGPVDPAELGVTLMHEHVLVDFGGAAVASRDRYDSDEAFSVILPQLQAIVERGCQTLVECTPAYLGRDPLLLRRLSEASGLKLITNTGYYGAADDIAVPAHAYEASADELAAGWIEESRSGIEGTGVRPGFMKIGVDAGPLSEIDHKLVVAAARCHLATGLGAHIHTGDGRAAFDIIDTFETEAVSPSAYVWVHAQNEPSRARHIEAAGRGVWVEFDAVHPDTLDASADAVLDMVEAGHLDRTLISQDAGWYHVGEEGGGEFRILTTLFDAFLPALRQRGLDAAAIGTLLVGNPAALFSGGRRPL